MSWKTATSINDEDIMNVIDLLKNVHVLFSGLHVHLKISKLFSLHCNKSCHRWQYFYSLRMLIQSCCVGPGWCCIVNPPLPRRLLHTVIFFFFFQFPDGTRFGSESYLHSAAFFKLSGRAAENSPNCHAADEGFSPGAQRSTLLNWTKSKLTAVALHPLLLASKSFFTVSVNFAFKDLPPCTSFHS